eukprot:4907466-Prymnesium_polylepis.1
MRASRAGRLAEGQRCAIRVSFGLPRDFFHRHTAHHRPRGMRAGWRQTALPSHALQPPPPVCA